jgi:beta-galactosidase/beta-glucuronidase
MGWVFYFEVLALHGVDGFVQKGKVLDAITEKVSFRRARVVQDKMVDQEGLTFLFEINNIRIFCGGRSLTTQPGPRI